MIIQENEDATYGASVSLIQECTGATQATAYRWKKNPESMPEAAKRLCRFAVWGDVTEVFGKGWQGFKVAHGKLYPPFFRGGFSPLEIAAMFFEMQELRYLRREIKRVEALLVTEKVRAEKYRAMIVSPSREYIF